MPTSPNAALATTFLPNLIKLQGARMFVGAIERNDVALFDPVWKQAYVQHKPTYLYSARVSPNGNGKTTWRYGVVSLPPPKVGETYLYAVVMRNDDPEWSRVFTLDKAYIVATRSDGTQVTERDGMKATKRSDGPMPVGGAVDPAVFIDAIANVINPVVEPPPSPYGKKRGYGTGG